MDFDAFKEEFDATVGTLSPEELMDALREAGLSCDEVTSPNITQVKWTPRAVYQQKVVSTEIELP